ncbi:MAG: cytochrome c oxidase assembly protein [Acidiferrobacterales bacterium]|nr:cytochrome c oxidase assembly protein [Acidiferrobacterales bacterium]
MSEPTRKTRLSNRRIAIALTATVFVMFGFGYALVPLYDLFCEITGIGGKPTVAVQQSDDPGINIDLDRQVWVEFTGNSTNGLPWTIKPQVSKTKVSPGEVHEVNYLVRNTSGRDIVGQAIPSVTPMQSARHVVKIECFCFNNQSLAAGEEKLMPVRFYVDPELEQDTRTVTLSYSFFEVRNSS